MINKTKYDVSQQITEPCCIKICLDTVYNILLRFSTATARVLDFMSKIKHPALYQEIMHRSELKSKRLESSDNWKTKSDRK